jgi:hypothetical protein
MTIDTQQRTDPILDWHLTNNIYPSVPQQLFPVCVRAIALAKDDDYEAMIELPDGIMYQGERVVRVGNVIEDFHLEDFVTLEL